MCLAPRYRRGPMARPSSPCRNTASLPDTPCAPTACVAAAASSSVRPIRTRTLLEIFIGRSPALVLAMAVVARRVDRLPGGEHTRGVFLLGRLERRHAGLGHRLRHRHPLRAIDGAPAGGQQIRRFNQRGRTAPDLEPLGFGFRRLLLDARSRHRGADRLEHDVGGRADDAPHDLLNGGDRRCRRRSAGLDRGGTLRFTCPRDDEPDAGDEQRRADDEQPVNDPHAEHVLNPYFTLGEDDARHADVYYGWRAGGAAVPGLRPRSPGWPRTGA